MSPLSKPLPSPMEKFWLFPCDLYFELFWASVWLNWFALGWWWAYGVWQSEMQHGQRLFTLLLRQISLKEAYYWLHVVSSVAISLNFNIVVTSEPEVSQFHWNSASNFTERSILLTSRSRQQLEIVPFCGEFNFLSLIYKFAMYRLACCDRCKKACSIIDLQICL